MEGKVFKINFSTCLTFSFKLAFQVILECYAQGHLTMLMASFNPLSHPGKKKQKQKTHNDDGLLERYEDLDLD